VKVCSCMSFHRQ